jgi:hypothetical protein
VSSRFWEAIDFATFDVSWPDTPPHIAARIIKKVEQHRIGANSVWRFLTHIFGILLALLGGQLQQI